LRIAHVILVSVASWFLSLQARAADPVAASSDVHALALIRLTAGSGDKMIEELVRGTLKDSHRWVLVKTAPSAEYLAKLEISRRAGGTELTLTVSKRDAGLLVHAQQYVTVEESVIDGAQLLVAQVNAALDGKPIPAQPAPDRPVLKPLPETLRPASGKGKRFDGSDDTDDRHLDFIVGLEGAFGPMSLSSSSVASGSQTFDLTHYAPAFTQSIDGHVHGAISLHAGPALERSGRGHALGAPLVVLSARRALARAQARGRHRPGLWLLVHQRRLVRHERHLLRARPHRRISDHPILRCRRLLPALHAVPEELLLRLREQPERADRRRDRGLEHLRDRAQLAPRDPLVVNSR
jgi:hypothetical protein